MRSNKIRRWFNKGVKIILCLLVVSCYSTSANEASTKAARQHIDTLNKLMLDYAGDGYKPALVDTIANIDVLFSPELDLSQVAYASIDQAPVIHISERFIEHLWQFSHTHQDELSEMKNTNSAFFTAIADVYLHELGHHALDAFYDDYTPPFYVTMIEQQAQKWADTMKINLELDENGVGRVVVLLTLLDNALVNQRHDQSRIHSVYAAKNRLDFECLGTFSSTAERVCNEFVSDLLATYQVK
jgi:hypothetical protein